MYVQTHTHIFTFGPDFSMIHEVPICAALQRHLTILPCTQIELTGKLPQTSLRSHLYLRDGLGLDKKMAASQIKQPRKPFAG